MITKKKFYISLLLLIFVVLMIPIIKFRLSFSNSIVIKSEIVFKYIDLGQEDFFRSNIFENILQKRRIFMLNNENEIDWFYVTTNDYNLCWEKDPKKLLEQKQSLLLTIETKKLLFGGYYPARIVEIEVINSKPIIRK